MDLELRDIHKFYGPTHANRGISFSVAGGSVHGVLGENGAGKSTLMKVISGYARRTSGEMLLDGAPIECATPAEATRRGIGMLYQDPLDFPSLTVLENFMLGLSGGLSLRASGHRARLLDLSGRLGFALDPQTRIERLTVGERQQLDLLRLLALSCRLLILDEPTTGISSLQKRVLFDAIRGLAASGKTVLLVSHKLEDVEALCDRVTVLRQGEVTGAMEAPFETERLLSMMFGEAASPPPRCGAAPGAPALALSGVSAPGGRAGLRGCTVTIREGEVVGLAGLEGSGQGAFLRAASGLVAPQGGSVRVFGHNLTGRGHLAFHERGVAFLPASRLEEGLIRGLRVVEHYALGDRSFLTGWREARERALSGIGRFCVRGAPESLVESLSGGNQQRLLLSLLPERPRLLLLEQPTRGLDVASSWWVWGRLLAHCGDGAAIVFSSAEIEEILAVADRVLVFFDGAVVLDRPVGETSAEEVGRAVAGKVSDASEGRAA